MTHQPVIHGQRARELTLRIATQLFRQYRLLSLLTHKEETCIRTHQIGKPVKV